MLANDIHLYIDQLKVDTIRMDRPIDWIHFGKMGREEGVLVIATQGQPWILEILDIYQNDVIQAAVSV